MNKAKIEACEKLCREFLERSKAVKADGQTMRFMHVGYGSRESGALRRTSLELTRALADLRRPG